MTNKTALTSLLSLTCLVVAGFKTGCADHVVPPDDQSVKVVSAAESLLKTLDEKQRAAVLFGFNDEDQRVRWSNLPTGIFERKGLRMGDLQPEQYQAVMALLQVTMSPAGYQQIVDNMAGEETLNTGEQRGRLVFGKDEYYFSILGTPSLKEPWMWQFGGHHLAINATMVADKITLGPSLTGGQPMRYSQDGKPVVQMEEEIAIAFELVNSLDAAQRKQAILGDTFADMVLGPGRDDIRPEPEGIVANMLSNKQKELIKKLVAQRVGLINAEDAAERMHSIENTMSEIRFSWRGPITTGSAAYYRVQGPTFFMEFSPQNLGGTPTNHVHAMYREFDNDYGEQWLLQK